MGSEGWFCAMRANVVGQTRKSTSSYTKSRDNKSHARELNSGPTEFVAKPSLSSTCMGHELA